ncbi:MAG: homoserine kinase, partial [Bacillota bacterium]|nr:homoserine kinase [Bacillota bacterium]
MRENNSIMIRVPASCANIGPGFDSFGIALSLYNRYEIMRMRGGCREIRWMGEPLVKDAENLVAKTIEQELQLRGREELGYRLIVHEQNIPVSRGLGSSSAAIVAGIMASDYLCDSRSDRNYLLHRAAVLEGHPDNSTAAILGKFCISKHLDNRVLFQRLDFFEDVKILLMIPSQKMSTHDARSVMPKTYPLEDVVFNLSNASLLISSIYQRDREIFSAALQDRIHTPYRISLIKEGEAVIEFVNKL